MLIDINLFDSDEAAEFRGILESADWVDGSVTAGHQSALVKYNRQLREDDPIADELGRRILSRLANNDLFITAALPARIFPPLFNRYEGGENFGNHIDNAIRISNVTGARIRTDLSATLFFSEPDTYEGGELLIDTMFGVQSVKLQAGSMILYPASSLHRVMPVTGGIRLASFFWIQSMVQDEGIRTILFDLDTAVRSLRENSPNQTNAVVQLTGVYHNLLRRYAEV
ncbi:MAG: Fe2+-dependent dioxygenase [Pyrinomonadaceae bacterium]|jgi:PKHD-type hydroxylase